MANKSLLVFALAFACLVAITVAVAGAKHSKSAPVRGHSTSGVVRPHENSHDRRWRCYTGLPHCNNQPNPVCGTDHRTYINHCVLRKYNCKDKNLQLLFHGHCRPGDVPRTMNNLDRDMRSMSRARSGGEEEQPEILVAEDEE